MKYNPVQIMCDTSIGISTILGESRSYDGLLADRKLCNQHHASNLLSITSEICQIRRELSRNAHTIKQRSENDTSKPIVEARFPSQNLSSSTVDLYQVDFHGSSMTELLHTSRDQLPGNKEVRWFIKQKFASRTEGDRSEENHPLCLESEVRLKKILPIMEGSPNLQQDEGGSMSVRLKESSHRIPSILKENINHLSKERKERDDLLQDRNMDPKPGSNKGASSLVSEKSISYQLCKALRSSTRFQIFVTLLVLCVFSCRLSHASSAQPNIFDIKFALSINDGNGEHDQSGSEPATDFAEGISYGNEVLQPPGGHGKKISRKKEGHRPNDMGPPVRAPAPKNNQNSVKNRNSHDPDPKYYGNTVYHANTSRGEEGGKVAAVHAILDNGPITPGYHSPIGEKCTFDDLSSCHWEWDTPDTERQAAGFIVTSHQQLLGNINNLTTYIPEADHLGDKNGEYFMIHFLFSL